MEFLLNTIVRSLLHYGLHFVFPVVFAWFFYRENWKKAAVILLLTILVDLDHLLASPIFVENRCSINFHVLHTNYAIAVYALLLIPKKSRLIALGLLFHMMTDFIDCQWIV